MNNIEKVKKAILNKYPDIREFRSVDEVEYGVILKGRIMGTYHTQSVVDMEYELTQLLEPLGYECIRFSVTENDDLKYDTFSMYLKYN